MSERLTFRHQPANPKAKKQNANPYRKKTKPLIQKKKGKKKEKKRQTLKSKPYIHIRILSSRLWLPPLRCNSIATQIRIPCSRSASIRKKKFQKEAKKKRRCSSSATRKTEKLSSSSAKASDSEAIQKIIQKVGMFFSPFFCFLFNYRF